MPREIFDTDELEVVDYATLTLSTTGAKMLTGASPAINSTTFANKVKRALITVETANARFRPDGTAPTTTEGHLVYIGDVLDFTGRSWRTLLNSTTLLQFIAESGAPKFKITYIK